MKFLHLAKWYIPAWSFAVCVYIFLRYLGQPGPIVNPMDASVSVDSGGFFMLAILGGIVVGLGHSALGLLFDHARFRRMSYGRMLLLKGAIFLLFITASFILITMLDFYHLRDHFDIRQWFQVFIKAPFIIPLVYAAGVASLIEFTNQVSAKFGKGNLQRMLMGEFYHPREEERIFMFLDMKASTTIAEQLGHLVFSRLLQDCFRDLPVVEIDQAEVYQYVGDEVVLSWPAPAGLKDNRCIRAYYRFTDRLRDRSPYYLGKYGVVPRFKAGVNIGMVTVAEVGVMKKEIAFHGDTLNTASRIQDLCTPHGKELLISDALASRMKTGDQYHLESIGHIMLRGKEKQVEILSVTRQASEKNLPDADFKRTVIK